MKSWSNSVLSLLLVFLSAPSFADFNLSNSPLFLNQAVNPRVMLTMSNDHQLYIKAYTDYSDLDGDGVIDTTYTDNVDYAGYFDSERCYQYSSGVFAPEEAANGAHDHSCSASNRWSGNFLNWASMTRMDIIRKVLYGGYRSIDTTADTILERSLIPFDAHAFAKVFKTNTPGEMLEFTPFNQTEITLCNLTEATGISRAVDTSINPPLMLAAEGLWPHWASDENRQCDWGDGSAKPQAYKQIGGVDYQVRVNACVAGKEASNCIAYPNSTVKKPDGILQHYGNADNGRPIQFGLMSGSYQKNKSGGVLRKNTATLAGNANSAVNEFDSLTGIFINQSSTDAGIINTLNRLRISSYNFTAVSDPWGGLANFYVNGCDVPGISHFNDGECIDWGNPLSEIYLESLRYFAGKSSPTSAFNANDSAFISGLVQVPWTDPLPSDEWCADNSIIAISTGLNSYDTDQLSNDIGINVDSKTNEVGALEGIHGSSFMIGSNGSNNNQLCTAKPITSLADVAGVCPEVPQLQGGYGIAGLAYYAQTEDMRTDRDEKQIIHTSSIALAESLPHFDIALPTGSISILPACRSRENIATSSWNTCTLMNVVVENLDYNASNEIIAGRLKIDWEDSTQGFDFDMDATHRLQFCVGASCNPSINNNEVKITSSIRQAAVGFLMELGFTVSGSDQDGVHLPLKLPSDAFIDASEIASGFFSLPWDPGNVRPIPAPESVILNTGGAAAAQLLENPLWYAAKYGGFKESNNHQNPQPDLQTEWDADADGIPDSYFPVTNPAKLGGALEKVLNKVISRTASASSIATNSTRLDTNTLIYQARFNSGTWAGEVLTYPILPDGSIGSVIWDAGELIPATSSRHIYSFDSVTGAGIEFKWSALNTAQKTALANSQDIVNYLRGDQSKEVQNGGPFRNRERLLGDIVNSDPWYVGHEDYGYDKLPGTEGSSYEAFIHNTGFTSRRKMLYVGANDGMLHGLDATTGVEQFAYIPGFLIPELAQLSSTSYTHRYYVDGGPRAAAAYIDTGAGVQWKTVLMGSTGAGGRGIFALDITNPDSFSESNILWEFTSNSDGDMGYSMPQPSLVRMANGQWAAIVANGYNSDSHKAILFIINLANGSIIAKLDTQTGNSSSPNGLSTPIPVDLENDGIVDVIYAGDMQGKLWKFDVSESNQALWQVAYQQGISPKPLFSACNDDPCTSSQAITAKPQVGRNPQGGVMVYFGTGQYFETGDNLVPANPQIQTYYGIWDNNIPVTGRDELQQQSILSETEFMGREYRVTSQHPVNYNNQKGWYLDLIAPQPADPVGERVITPSLLRNRRIIFTTLTPSPDRCSFGGSSWLMEIDAITGAQLAKAPIDVNNDKEVNDDDVVPIGGTDSSISGVKTTIGIIKTPGVISAGDKEFKYTSGSSGNLEVVTESNDGLSGRLSWRELR